MPAFLTRFLLIFLIAVSPVIANAKTVIYEFYAPWCHVCKALAPKVTQLEKKGFHVIRVNIDEDTDLSDKYKIRGVPTTVLVKDGKEQNRIVGDVPFDELLEFAQGE